MGFRSARHLLRRGLQDFLLVHSIWHPDLAPEIRPRAGCGRFLAPERMTIFAGMDGHEALHGEDKGVM